MLNAPCPSPTDPAPRHAAERERVRGRVHGNLGIFLSLVHAIACPLDGGISWGGKRWDCETYPQVLATRELSCDGRVGDRSGRESRYAIWHTRHVSQSIATVRF